MKIKLLEPIPGYEDVAEFGTPTKGQTYLHIGNTTKPLVASTNHALSASAGFIILTPLPPPDWRALFMEAMRNIAKYESEKLYSKHYAMHLRALAEIAKEKGES